MRAILIAAALLTATAPTAQASDAAAPTAQASAPASAFERDRQSILAQAGQYRVHFDMRENVSFRADYDPMEGKLSGGSEIVRVVYDHGDRISLQHILVMEHEGQSIVVKHWRHDWVYQPASVLTSATIRAIAERCPATLEELGGVRGVGPMTLADVGEDVLETVRRSVQTPAR